MGQEYFRKGRYAVTSGAVRARNRTIQLETIEGVDVGRPIFFMTLAVGGGLLGLGALFGDLLYIGEIAVSAVTAAVLLGASWSIGSLRVYSKLTGEKGWAVLGRFNSLQQMRGAIEAALADQRNGTGRRSDLIGDND